MNDIILNNLSDRILQHDDKLRIIPIERLKDLKREIEEFRNHESLNEFQKFIASNFYNFDLPAVNFKIRSIIIIASAVPPYAKVVFNMQGKKIPAVSLARSFEGKKDPQTSTFEYLSEFVKLEGYNIEQSQKLPLKRLSVKSGLASYGRNNICYIESMGSFFTLTAYFSDIPCNDVWKELRMMEQCTACTSCRNNCPTGAIPDNPFLINTEKCLSYYNESADDFPEWLPASVHHSTYDCLLCQNVCPVNKSFIGNFAGPVEFDESETDLLLSEKPMSDYPGSLFEKVNFLGMDNWPLTISRNIKMLIKNHDEGKKNLFFKMTRISSDF